MNDLDGQALARAVDSLLNYETVKYFGNEAHEARRYDVGRRRYEDAAIRSSRTLSLLNIGQGAIISVGLVAVMAMAGQGVIAGTMTIGDFVAVNAFLIQLYMPLNMLGFAYREIRNALVNMEKMFGLLDVPAEIADKPGAPPLAVGGDWTEVVGQDQQPKLRRASLAAGAIKIEIKKPGAEELESLMFYERVDAETVHTRFVRADTGTTFVVVNKVCK